MKEVKQQLAKDIIEDFRFSSIAPYELKDILDVITIEDKLNEAINMSKYGSSVVGIDFVFIAVEPNNKLHEEYRKYKKKSKRLILNLKLDYEKFKVANKENALKQMASLFLNAIKNSKKFKIKDYNNKQLYEDVKVLFIHQKWLEHKT